MQKESPVHFGTVIAMGYWGKLFVMKDIYLVELVYFRILYFKEITKIAWLSLALRTF